MTFADDRPLCLGVDADSGMPLAFPDDTTLSAVLGVESMSDALARRTRGAQGARGLACEVDTDPNDLADAGWGVIIGRGVEAGIRTALAPLLRRREAEAGRNFRVFDGDDAPNEVESAQDWLTRHGVRVDVVDPTRGVPFYLLIVASPAEISFEFQYALDLYWGVGRLWFESVQAFGHYSQSVEEWERDERRLTSRKIALFAPRHAFDAATQAFHDLVAKPLASGSERVAPLGAKLDYRMHAFLAGDATKEALTQLLCGRRQEGDAPALLFTGSHGMAFQPTDSRQGTQQGALVCQDWTGHGAIQADHWFGAADLPADARVHGLVHFLFACHGGGCTAFDDFDVKYSENKRIAPRPFLAALPQALLSHPNGGALAVLAHVERAWAYSFQSGYGSPQTQGFRDVLTRMLRGDRIGYATDSFNLRWAAISAQLAELRRSGGAGERVLGRLWIERNDARNYIVVGDPAVRMRSVASQ